jgi:hypothetical protein
MFPERGRESTPSGVENSVQETADRSVTLVLKTINLGDEDIC